MKYVIAVVSISVAAALPCGTACAGGDGAQILSQAQLLERIKQAANVDVRPSLKRPTPVYWDTHRLPSPTW